MTSVRTQCVCVCVSFYVCVCVLVECKKINIQKTIKLFWYYIRIQVDNISRYTHTHTTYVHTYIHDLFA